MSDEFRYVVCKNSDGTEYGVVKSPKGRDPEHVSRTDLFHAVKGRPGGYYTAVKGTVGPAITIVDGALVSKHVKTNPNAVKQDNLGELPSFEEFTAETFAQGLK